MNPHEETKRVGCWYADPGVSILISSRGSHDYVATRANRLEGRRSGACTLRDRV